MFKDLCIPANACPVVGHALYKRFLDFFREEVNGEKMPTYTRWLALSYAPTLALACAAALPCGVGHIGLPFGIKVIGPNGSDARVLQIAHALQQVLNENEATSRPVANVCHLPPQNLRPAPIETGREPQAPDSEPQTFFACSLRRAIRLRVLWGMPYSSAQQTVHRLVAGSQMNR
jgi:hypothetical protein